MPIILLITSLLSGLVGLASFFKFGGQMPSNASAQGGVSVLSDHPAVVVQTTPSGTATVSNGTVATVTQKGPTAKTIAADVVNQPWTVWGLGVLAFALAPLVSQVRAGAHEATETVKDVGRSASAGYDRIDNADNYTQNKSRRARG